MLVYLLALLMLALALIGMTLEKTYFYVPKKELKRQAAVGDELASILFRAAAYGQELRILLWTITALGAAGGIVLFAREVPLWLGLLTVTSVLLLCYIWLPRTRLTLFGARMAEWSTPAVVEILRLLHPLLKRVVVLTERYHAGPHTGLYEREDLEELFIRQKLQSDNRIEEEDLERLERLLQFGRYTVSDVMTPKQKVIAIDVKDAINPIQLDEWHKSGHQRFPVYDGSETNMVGSLTLEAVTDTRHHGSVADFCDPRLVYIHESDALDVALQAFSETHQHMYIVVDSAGEYVGIVTLSDILRYLGGTGSRDKFGRFDERMAVAGRQHHHAKSHDNDTSAEDVRPTETRT